MLKALPSENVCASANYYYDSENISESLLSFRQHIDDPSSDVNYEQEDHRALEMEFIYGIKNKLPGLSISAAW